MTQIVGYNNANEIWLALSQIYALASITRLLVLRAQLQSLKKGDMSALDYIQRIKGQCNSLATIGEPISIKDKLIYIFNGLD